MKRYLFSLILILNVAKLAFTQVPHIYFEELPSNGWSGHPTSYTTIRDTALISRQEFSQDMIKSDIIVPSNKCFSSNKFMHFEKDIYDNITGHYVCEKRIDMATINTDEYKGYVSIDDIIVTGSYPIPERLLKYFDRDNTFHWIPSYTLDIIKSKDRTTIFKYEPGRSKGGYDYTNVEWYIGEPTPAEASFTNFEIYFTSYFSFPGLRLRNLFVDNYGRDAIKIVAINDPDAVRFNRHLVDYIYSNNFPKLESKNQLSFIMEVNGKRMRLYNAETKHIFMDLIQVSNDFYDKYIEFIKTNKVPKGLVIPPEIATPWPGDIAIPPPDMNPAYTHRLTSNLRLRSSPDISGEIITTLEKGAKVRALEVGMRQTIDGITAPWVWVKTSDGKTGWCFGGYLNPKP